MVQAFQLTPDESTQLQELKIETDKLIVELGEVSLQKIGLELREKELKKKVEELAKKEDTITQTLTEKYGSISVNLENFTYTPTSA